MDFKLCSKCKLEKDFDQFPNDKRNLTGKSSWCRSCHCESTKKWKRNNKKKVDDYVTKYDRTERGRFLRAKRGAKRRNVEWNLSLENFKELISDECFYCEGELNTNKSTGVGLDRVDSSQGYEYDNLVPCCSICNKIKNNYLTLNETIVAVEAIIKLRRKELNHGEPKF